MLTNEEEKEIFELYQNLYNSCNMGEDNHFPIRSELLNLICDKSIEALKEDPMLLELTAPINVIGDVHGQFGDCMKFIELGGDPKTQKYLFLGDYVDRGPNSIETITSLLCLKLLYPQNIFLLRGNHETEEISRLYGFLDECQEFYTESIWAKFNEVFAYLPLAAVISQRIFCVHGGISQGLDDPRQLLQIQRPLVDIQDDSFISDLLWADPDNEITGFCPGPRGISFTFGLDVAREFLTRNDYDLICRAHQVVDEGFQFPFYPDQTVVTVFSAPNYCRESGNAGAILKISEGLTCSFDFVHPDLSGKDYGNSRPDAPY